MKNIIEVTEDMRVGNFILEKGDKIEVLEEALIPRPWEDLGELGSELADAISDYGFNVTYDGENLYLRTKHGRFVLEPYEYR